VVFIVSWAILLNISYFLSVCAVSWDDGGWIQARNMVLNSSALARTRELAREYSAKALEALECLPPTMAKDALAGLVGKVVDRTR
jgi:geranylgeranyl pyrophosphate synthase